MDVLARLSGPLLCNRAACNLRTSTLCRVRMTSRFPTPAEILSFPTPNYVNPHTLRPLAIGIITPVTTLVVIFISCRFYSRTVLTKTLGWDDGIMLLAAIISVGNNIMVIASMFPQYRMGYHLWDVPPQILFGTLKSAQMGMASQLLFTVLITLMKTAILLTYLRIFPSRLNKHFCYIMLFYTISLNTACFFVTLFQCAPVSTYWNIFKYMGRAKCLNIKAIYYFHSGQNTLSDFLIFLWPARDLLSVRASLRQRVTLTCMFSLGVVVCGAGVARVYYTHMYLNSYDVFWQGAKTFIIMCVEGGIGIVCGCLPGCKPLMNKLFPRYFEATNNGSQSYPRRWQPNYSKQTDDEESTLPTESLRSDSMRMTNLKNTDVSITSQPTTLQRSSSKQTQKSVVPTLSPRISTLSRSTSLTTTRTANARTPNHHRSPSHATQNTFTTTITAQPHLPRSTSRHSSRWGSTDMNKPLPMRPAPPAIAARGPSGSGFRRSRNTSRELSAISNASTEMFILQGEDGGPGKQSPERKNEIWMG
ncbi:uncharacterized protein M421DRAFT_381924 [Didymella exigua CBS 183.55]|uniref:Rhodopsin domain-containing protein n=1 Tax=Didymella exigua CBS 183.55 TaxID=1150837 RepID=A0A6A5RRA0_9PLEO|nr:uncharacterized protein M421DRAFT_381924 [Didymella exigua CBS 183.55]KAF1929973.1 hypothetical protein M421DRAFT_381924 [Didymella exigua CBS 183.55]